MGQMYLVPVSLADVVGSPLLPPVAAIQPFRCAIPSAAINSAPTSKKRNGCTNSLIHHRIESLRRCFRCSAEVP